MSAADYAKLKVAELKEELKKRSLQLTGNKSELVKRLTEDDSKEVELGTKREAEESAEGEAHAKRARLNGEHVGIKAILMDIEGTTTPISFVHDKLFPYAKAHLGDFLDAHWDDEDVKDSVKLAEADDTSIASAEGSEAKKLAFTIAMREALTADKKLTSLKKLQGLIWKAGYESSELKGIVFDDVPQAFERWHNEYSLFIYSSGSIAAQKLLFGQSEAGDLTTHLSDYFDTTTGPKVERKSYELIAKAVSLDPASILFLTDMPKEAHAAKAANLRTALLDRPGNAPLSEEDRSAHKVLKDFDEVDGLL